MNEKQTVHSLDIWLLVTIVTLMVFGLVMLYSASFFVSFAYLSGSGRDPAFVVSRQLLFAFGGGLLLIALALLDYHRWQRVPILGLVAVVAALILVLFIGEGPEGSDTKSWFRLGPMQMQPSEFAKLALVLYMAAWLPKKGESIRTFAQGSAPFGIVVAIVAGLVARQPDFGTAIVIIAMAAALFFVAGADLLQMTVGGIAGTGALWLLLSNSPTKMGRFSYWWDPFLGGCEGVTYQMCQALMALGSGGVGGVGLGASRQKFFWLPAAENDAIFAIIGEELGMFGAIIVLVLYGAFIYRGFRIALTAPDRFGQLLAAGVTCWITVQALVNLGGVTASLPLTGVPLPFISAGGSSLVTCMAGAGLLLSVSARTVPEKKVSRASDTGRWWNRWTRVPSFSSR
jgi:cell division protein FtsW